MARLAAEAAGYARLKRACAQLTKARHKRLQAAALAHEAGAV